jgi:hypothetical protein
MIDWALVKLGQYSADEYAAAPSGDRLLVSPVVTIITTLTTALDFAYEEDLFKIFHRRLQVG